MCTAPSAPGLTAAMSANVSKPFASARKASPVMPGLQLGPQLVGAAERAVDAVALPGADADGVVAGLQQPGRHVEARARRHFRRRDGDLADLDVVDADGEAGAFRHHRDGVHVADLQLRRRRRLGGGQVDGQFAAVRLAFQAHGEPARRQPAQIGIDLDRRHRCLGGGGRKRRAPRIAARPAARRAAARPARKRQAAERPAIRPG